MCKHGGELINHLFLHCEVAIEIWSGIHQVFGVARVMPRRVSECLGSLRGQMGNHLALHIWRVAPLCVMWCIWRERNN